MYAHPGMLTGALRTTALAFHLAAFAMGAVSGCGEPRERDPGTPLLTDEFFVGINYPWLNYGHDFGDAWGHQGVEANRAVIDADLDSIAANGIEVIRWFLFADGRAAPEFNGAWVTGLDEHVIGDVVAMLDIARSAEIEVVVTLFDYLWFESTEIVNGVALGGHAETLLSPAARETFFEQALVPLLESVGDHPAILAWDIINEPKWAITGQRPLVAESIPLAAMQSLVDATAAVLHQHSTRPVTLGSADIEMMLGVWSTASLDFLQFHAYDGLPTTPWTEMGIDVPVLLGEIPTTVSPDRLRSTIEAAYLLGYAGVLGWSFRAEDDASDFANASTSLKRWREYIDDL